MHDMPNRKSGARGIRFPSNNTIEVNFPFKVDEGVRKYIRAALGMVTGWYNVEKAETHPEMPQLEIVSAVEMETMAGSCKLSTGWGPSAACNSQFHIRQGH